MNVENCSFYIAPFSAMSQSFLNTLAIGNSKFLGFIDAAKCGDNICKIEDIKNKFYDYIYIISPNHALRIYDYYKKSGINSKKIIFINYKNELFYKSNYYSFYIENKYIQYRNNIFKFFMNNFKKKFENDKDILLLAIDFIDLNIKDLYLYLEKYTDLKPIIVTNNQKQLKKIQEKKFNVVSFLSLQFFYYSLTSKIKILDHSAIEKEILISFINSKIIQIWHGIPLKKIGHLTNYKSVNYDIVVSTSDFVTEYSFGKLFNTKKFLNSGYPRNDIFFKKIFEEKDLILTNREIFDFIRKSNKKIFVYMPTWRPDLSINNPINLDALNTFARENEILIIIKNHPFTRDGSFYDSVIDTKKYYYSRNYQYNIIFYPIIDDIYPILSISDCLITDYSSVYFDYLLVNKPIIFFIYDLEEYIKSHGEFMIDFDESTPGEKPRTFEEIKLAMISCLENDNYKLSRKLLKNKLFKNQYGNSSEVIYKEIESLFRKGNL